MRLIIAEIWIALFLGGELVAAMWLLRKIRRFCHSCLDDIREVQEDFLRRLRTEKELAPLKRESPQA